MCNSVHVTQRSVQNATAQQLAADVSQLGTQQLTSTLDEVASLDKALSRLPLNLAFHAILSGEVRVCAALVQKPGHSQLLRPCVCALQVLEPQQVPALSRLCMQTGTCMVPAMSMACA